MFNFVQLKPDVEDRLEKLGLNISNSVPKKQVNVLILGIDAVSHMNFIRTMPLSHKYLSDELSALSMDGYTKVGDNTFPNIVPALMGLTVDEISNMCWDAEKKGEFDNCPFIWKNFSSEGYRTGYAEDAAWMGIFNYNKVGFLKQPTDYHLRTLTYSMAKEIGFKKPLNAKLCYGPRLAFSVLLENIKKFVSTMVSSNKRFFQFTWATSLFHDYLNHPSFGDQYLLNMLKWLKEGGYLQNTVLILMSDHGIRWGGIRETFQGKVEERMPFLYYSFPKWFSEKYRSAVSNMKLNRDRLTTPFDFYETLKDLLHLENIGNELVKQRHLEINNYLLNSVDLPRGISLFLPIPLSRDCEAAGIEYHWCVCHNMEPVSTSDSIVQEAAAAVVTELNRRFLEFPQCSTLRLDQVSNAQAMKIQANSTDTETFAKATPTRYSVTLSTVPGNAVFEATLNVHNGKKRSWELAGDVSRINLYGTQSRCVTDYNMKKYCFCQ